MNVRFWGVRGSVATSGSHVARIGGNTSCLEVTSQGHRIILDAGTGLRALGDEIGRSSSKGIVDAAMFFSHLHWDHVQGFPFFGPGFHPLSSLKLFGPGANGGQALREVLSAQMQPPNFPVPLSAMRAQMTFASAPSGVPIETGPFVVTPFEVPHPNGCMGYRIEADGRSFVYMTDVEISLATLEPRIGKMIAGADALVLDAQYTPDEYAGVGSMSKKGWGHSTNVDAAQIAQATGVGRLFLFHHDPSHHDDQVENMAEAARTFFPASEPAREGKLIQVA